jgi:hypothetical protein
LILFDIEIDINVLAGALAGALDGPSVRSTGSVGRQRARLSGAAGQSVAAGRPSAGLINVPRADHARRGAETGRSRCTDKACNISILGTREAAALPGWPAGQTVSEKIWPPLGSPLTYMHVHMACHVHVHLHLQGYGARPRARPHPAFLHSRRPYSASQPLCHSLTVAVGKLE